MTGRQRVEVGRFMASLAALVALVVVVPLLLTRVASARFGSPSPLGGVRTPWQWSASDIGDALGNPLGDDAVIDAVIRISVCVVWIAVIVIAVTTVIEVVHMIRHRGLAMPAVRGASWAQGIARYIAVGLLVVLPLVSARPSLAATRSPVLTGTSPVVATLVASPTQAPSAPLAPAPPPRADASTYVVKRGDSVFSIAADLAGNDDRRTMDVANEILDANLGAVMPDGQRFTNPAYIEPGWVLVLPAGAQDVFPVRGTTPEQAAPSVSDVSSPDQEPIEQTSFVVESGNTLWGIAEDELGTGAAWVEIWEENAGDDMGGGRTFDDPNLILPGWELELPAGESMPVEANSMEDPAAEPAGSDVSVHTDVDAPTVTDVESARVDTTVTPSAQASATAAPSATATPNTSTPATSATNVAAAPSPPAVATTSTTTTVWAGGPAAQPAVAPSERGVAPDAPSPIRFEHAAMLAAGILALVGVRRRQRLRAARPRSRVPEPRPEVVETELLLRRIDAGERAARIDVACRAAAFELIDTEVQIVVVQVSAEGDIVLTLSGGAAAPSPWHCAGSTWTLPAGVPVELLSDAARRVGMPCVALVQLGVDDDGDDVLVDLEACGTLAIDADPSQADAVVRALATGLATSQYAEIAHLITVSLADDVLLGHRNAHRADSVDAAFDLAAALVGSTSTNDRTSFELRSLRTAGEMWEPAIILLHGADRAGADSVITQEPRPGHGIGLVAAVGPDELIEAPARLLGEIDRWDLVVAGRTIPMTPIGLDRADIAAVVAVVQDAERPLIWMDDIPAEVAGDISRANGDPPDSDESSDPVQVVPAGPFEPMDHSIVVTLLGGVSVIDRDGVSGHFERSKTVELIAWLATHRRHSTRGAARTALWELDVRDATFANVVSEARRGLGRLVAPPEGEEWLARTLTEQLPLHRWVVTDAQLIEQRLDQARLEPPAQAIETLRPAVEMVTGMPFADTSYLWPDAEGITSNLVLLAIGATAELAGHALSIGDTELVFWATGRGLAVLPGHEELIALRMRAHARAGDLAGVRQEWESYERVIVVDTWSDGEPAPKLLALRRELLSNLRD